MTFTVTSAASDRSLLTLAELRAAVGVTGAGRDEDLRELGAAVSSAIVGACKVRAAGATPPTLRLETLTETLRLDCAREWLVLARRPIVSVTSVTECDTDLTTDDYEIEAGSGMLRRLCADTPSLWLAGKIVVVYSAGWATVPDPLRRAAQRLARAFWAEDRPGADPNLKRVRVEGVSEREWWVPPSSDPAIPTDVLDLLRDYMNG